MDSASKKGEPILVFVRGRPVNKQELDAYANYALEVLSPKELCVTTYRDEHKYTFDRVFNINSKQQEIYDEVAKPLIAELLAGYNCTIFAYGQTDTGKTYTMVGKASNLEYLKSEVETTGIIPRAMSQLFADLNSSGQKFSVRISYVEMYNEEIFDLLSETDVAKSLRLNEDQNENESVIIEDVEEVLVKNKSEVYRFLEKGFEKKRTASSLRTTMYADSHTIFSAVVHIHETTEDGEYLVKTGKINFVDLPGSENITKCLLTLDRVIKAIVENDAYVPYRESKMTRILQDSLGGRTKTSIIATISPATSNVEHTINTINYSRRARSITNRPEINQLTSKQCLLSQYTEEIENLKKDLAASRCEHGIYLDEQIYKELIAEHDLHKMQLTERIAGIRKLAGCVKEMEDCKAQIETNFLECSTSIIGYKSHLKQCQRKLLETERETSERNAQAKMIYEEQADNAAEEATRNKVENLYGVSRHNKIIMNNLIHIWESCFETHNMSSDYLKAQHGMFNKSLIDIVRNGTLEQEDISHKIIEHCLKVVSGTTVLEEKMFAMIRKCHEKFEKSSNITQNELSVSLVRIASVVRDSLAAIKSQLLSDLNDIIMAANESHKNFVHNIFGNLGFIKTLNETGLESVTSAMNDTKLHVFNKLYEFNELLDQNNHHNKNQENKHKQYDHTLNEKIKYLEAGLTELKAISKDYNTGMLHNFATKDIWYSTMKTFNMDLHNKISDRLNDIIQSKITNMEQLSAVVDEIRGDVNSYNVAILEFSKDLRNMYKSTANELNAVSPLVAIKASTITDVLSEMAEKMRSKNTAHMERLNNDMAKDAQNMQSFAQIIKSEAAKSFEMTKKVVETLFTEQESYAKSFSFAHSETGRIIRILNHNVTHFIKEFVAPGHHADSTDKGQAIYPRILTESSPKVMLTYDIKSKVEEFSVDTRDKQSNAIEDSMDQSNKTDEDD